MPLDVSGTKPPFSTGVVNRKKVYYLGKVRFFYWGRGGVGRGFGGEGHSVNILQNGEGQTSFMPNWGRVMGFFGKEKITPR